MPVGTNHALPRTLRPFVEGYRWRRLELGESGADLYRLTARDRPPLFLKYASGRSGLDLSDEAARLRWLQGRTKVPAVIAIATKAGQQWLLMTALPGCNAEQASMPASAKVRAIAEALKELHALDPADCPFREGLDEKIARAGQNVRRKLVAEEHFDPGNAGRSAEDLYTELLATRPQIEDVVVTHGDATFANFMLDGRDFSGFVDCARTGLADRYQDLALASRSIEYDLGRRWIAPFLAHYGLAEIDPDRLAFYRLLDEFF